MKLKYFFKPLSVAIIGASADKNKIGSQILQNIIASDYKGDIYPINLTAKKIFKYQVFSSLENIAPNKFSSMLAIIAIPAEQAVLEVEKCGRLGVKNIIIVSAGFQEIGSVGTMRNEKLQKIAIEYGLNILGPNCLGFINNIFKLNASFSVNSPGSGHLALLSQSGAVGSAALDWLKSRDVNFGYFISLGNKSVLTENDFLEYLVADSEIEAILFYLEDIKDGKKFIEIASAYAHKKPIIVLKSGLSNKGKEISMSHTGALAGSSDIIEAGLRRAGVIMVDDLENLFDLLNLLRAKASQQVTTKNIKIITNAGGLAVLSADAAEKYGLKLVESLDILGDADAARYKNSLQKVLAKNDKASILVLLTPQAATRPLEVAKDIVSLSAVNKKSLILASFVGGLAVEEAKKYLMAQGVPVFDYPERAIKALSQLVKRQSLLTGLTKYNYSQPALSKKTAKVSSSDYLELFSLLKKCKIPAVKTVKYEDFVVQKKVKDIAFPVVLKIVGPDFIHKTDKGGIVLNLKNQLELEKEAKKLNKKYQQQFKTGRNYLVIQPQIFQGLELIVGLKRDDSFGYFALLGVGGIYAEIFKQTKLVVADLDQKRAIKFIESLPFYPVLNGARGKKTVDIKKLADILVKISQLAGQYENIKELDINPLFLVDNKILVGDIRLVTL